MGNKARMISVNVSACLPLAVHSVGEAAEKILNL